MEKSRVQEQDDGHAVARLRQIVSLAKVAILTTLTDAQELRSRPLHTERMDEDGTLWFIINAAAAKVREIHAHGGKVGVSYVDMAHQNYVSLSGTAHLVEGTEAKAALWSQTAEIWFPGGKEDASIALLKVIPERGEYWDGPSTAVGQLFAFARAAVTGNVESFGTQRKFKVQ